MLLKKIMLFLFVFVCFYTMYINANEIELFEKDIKFNVQLRPSKEHRKTIKVNDCSWKKCNNNKKNCVNRGKKGWWKKTCKKVCNWVRCRGRRRRRRRCRRRRRKRGLWKRRCTNRKKKVKKTFNKNTNTDKLNNFLIYEKNNDIPIYSKPFKNNVVNQKGINETFNIPYSILSADNKKIDRIGIEVGNNNLVLSSNGDKNKRGMARTTVTQEDNCLVGSTKTNTIRNTSIENNINKSMRFKTPLMFNDECNSGTGADVIPQTS